MKDLNGEYSHWRSVEEGSRAENFSTSWQEEAKRI